MPDPSQSPSAAFPVTVDLTGTRPHPGRERRVAATGAERGLSVPQVERVPVRTIAVAIALVVVTAVALWLVVEVRRVLVWILVAAFFAVALHPAVSWVQARVPARRRSLATLLVFLAVFLVLLGLAAVFVVPLAQEGAQLARSLPQTLADAQAGRGPVGDLLDRLNVLAWLREHSDSLQSFASRLGTPALALARAAATTVAGVVTVFVLAYLMVLEGPAMVRGAIGLLPSERAERVGRVAADCARTVTGYISGNLLISVICGALTYIVLKVMGVPFAGLIALFVAVMDLIPLVGATLGAIVAVVGGFVHSVPAGIVVLVFFLAYQQLENHLLQPLILSRTVKLNPLTVLVAILLGVELAGILGALLAIPVAGMLQVVVRDLWDHRRGRPKAEPTVGPDHVPVDLSDDVALRPPTAAGP